MSTLTAVAQPPGVGAEFAKPRLRGWIHAFATPAVLTIAVVLVALAPAVAGRLAVGIFGLTALSLFATSAIYHIGNGRVRVTVTAVLKKIDHANIFLIIAGTYTPLAVLLLPADLARTIIMIVWSGALFGLVTHIAWKNAPRWIYAPVYVALGWVAVAFLNQFAAYGGPIIVGLIIGGGLAYTVGAIMYALKRPVLSPKWFGFHELFHACTVLGFAAHTIAIFLATIAARAM
jgi:hemolysin III